MKKSNLKLLMAITLYLISMLSWGVPAEPAKNKLDFNEINTNTSLYKLNNTEKLVLITLINEDISGFIRGASTISASVEKIITSSTIVISNKHDENEVEASEHYKDKKILITGKITRIKNESAREPLNIILEGNKNLSDFVLYFPTPNIDKIIKLKKGSEISSVCSVIIFEDFKSILNDCVLAEDYSVKLKENWKKSIEKLINGENPDSFGLYEFLSYEIISLAKDLKQNKKCKDEKSCLELLKNSKHDFSSKENSNKTKIEFNQVGIQLPDFDEWKSRFKK